MQANGEKSEIVFNVFYNSFKFYFEKSRVFAKVREVSAEKVVGYREEGPRRISVTPLKGNKFTTPSCTRVSPRKHFGLIKTSSNILYLSDRMQE